MGIINALPDQYIPEATTSAAGLMSATDKTKLNGIESGAQANPGNATTSAAGLMSAEDKTKLDGIATGATAVEVVDSLSDTSTTKALSAGKGKELSDQISTYNTASLTTLKGTLESWSRVDRIGKTVCLTMKLTANADISAWTEIANVPTGFRPHTSLNFYVPVQIGSTVKFDQAQVLDTGAIRIASAIASGNVFGITVTFVQ